MAICEFSAGANFELNVIAFIAATIAVLISIFVLYKLNGFNDNKLKAKLFLKDNTAKKMIVVAVGALLLFQLSAIIHASTHIWGFNIHDAIDLSSLAALILALYSGKLLYDVVKE